MTITSGRVVTRVSNTVGREKARPEAHTRCCSIFLAWSDGTQRLRTRDMCIFVTLRSQCVWSRPQL
jgi:hypothetical protein